MRVAKPWLTRLQGVCCMGCLLDGQGAPTQHARPFQRQPEKRGPRWQRISHVSMGRAGQPMPGADTSAAPWQSGTGGVLELGNALELQFVPHLQHALAVGNLAVGSKPFDQLCIGRASSQTHEVTHETSRHPSIDLRHPVDASVNRPTSALILERPERGGGGGRLRGRAQAMGLLRSQRGAATTA